MREMRVEVGKKTPKKRWLIPNFYDVTRLIFEILCPATQKYYLYCINTLNRRSIIALPRDYKIRRNNY